MVKKDAVAVVTDSISPDFFLPAFRKYYTSQLDADIYVIVPHGKEGEFQPSPRFNIIPLPVDHYNDDVRLGFIADLVKDLLNAYTWVIHADCDEILIADPRRYKTLGEYLRQSDAEYISALGYDVYGQPDDEALDLARPILGEQRKYCVQISPMNKTAVTRIPLRWGRGFHECDHKPELGELFLFHLKRADIRLQHEFGVYLAEFIKGDDFIKNYYQTPVETLRDFHQKIFARKVTRGWDEFIDGPFVRQFLDSLALAPETGLWRFKRGMSQKLVELPAEFHGIA